MNVSKEKFIDPSDTVKKIIATNNIKYIKSCIVDREKLGLGSSCITELIIATNDLRYIKNCIKNKNNLRLAPYHIKKLIIATNNVKFIKKYIRKYKKINLCSLYLSELILSTKDEKYINKCIENKKLDSFVITKLISEIKNVDYIKNCIEGKTNIKIYSSDISYLIKSLNDIKYVEKCIKDRKKISLDKSDIVDIIIHMNNIEYIKKIVNKNKLNLKKIDLIKLILSTNDYNFINECLNNTQSLCLNNSDKNDIILSLVDKHMLNGKKNFINNKSKVILPNEITIGIEIESVGNFSEKINGFSTESGIWKSKPDETVVGNIIGEKEVEIVSPILQGLNKITIKEIKSVTNLLNRFNQHVNDSCGGHIHIGFNYIKDSDAFINLLELWCNMEYELYIIGNEANTLPRGIEYANPVSRLIETSLKRKTLTLNRKMSLENLKIQIIKFQGTRGKSINFLNLRPGKINTIEFRCPNGTLNSNIWIQNIELFGGLVQISQKISDIQNKNIYERTYEETKILNNFNMIKSTNISKSKKLLILLEMIIKDKIVVKEFIKRYNSNKKLLKKNFKLNRLLKSKISQKVIEFDKW